LELFGLSEQDKTISSEGGIGVGVNVEVGWGV